MLTDMNYGPKQARQVANVLERIAKGLRDGTIVAPVRVTWAKHDALRVVHEERDGDLRTVERVIAEASDDAAR